MKTGTLLNLILVVCIFATTVTATPISQRVRGTLVIAIPLNNGLVTCADKRLFNLDTGTYTDNNIKIRKVDNNVLFVATGTVGFYDLKSKKIVFDASDITADYTPRHLSDGDKFWDGLKTEIRSKLRKYFAARPYSEWPESDKSNNNLLFNLIFYSLDRGVEKSHTLQIFYEKQRTPVVNVTGPISEEIRKPKLTGKGRELMAYIARDASLSSDPSILKFDEGRFDIAQTSVNDAVEFARKMFRLTNTGVPEAQVSATFDCALLSHRQGFQWIEGGP